MNTYNTNDKYLSQRLHMVQEQLVKHGIRDERVLKIMSEVPRHLFVPDEYENLAYNDGPLPIGEEQTISQPFMVAIMTECLELKGNEKILEVGTGSGYQAAILSKLVKQVYTMERLEGLALRAKNIFQDLGYHNIDVIIGDGSVGLPAKSPYQGIIVTAYAPQPPQCLLNQLDMGGRLVIPVGNPYEQTLQQIKKKKTGIECKNILECTFVPLLGKEGWEDQSFYS